MKVLIDGDIFRYRCAFAAERSRYLVELTNASGHKEYRAFDGKKEADSYGDRVTKGVERADFVVWSRKDLQPIENCLQIVKSCLENTLSEVQERFADEKLDVSIWLSGKTNFRNSLAKTRPYKGNREDTPKPTYHKDVGEYLVGVWDAVYSEGIEADDAIGIGAMAAKDAGENYIIVSNDKDLKQIPGNHYDWIKKEFSSVSPKEAKFQLFAQVLSGDATDNIPGLGGVGPATAAKILEGAQSPEEMVDRVAAYYQEEVATKEYLMEQWSLVYILKHHDEHWDDTKEGKYFCSKYLQSSDVASSSSV